MIISYFGGLNKNESEEVFKQKFITHVTPEHSAITRINICSVRVNDYKTSMYVQYDQGQVGLVVSELKNGHPPIFHSEKFPAHDKDKIYQYYLLAHRTLVELHESMVGSS